MLTPSRQLLRQGRPIALALLLTLAGGLSAPFTPVAYAATTPPPSGSVELSPTPPNQTQSVPPNVVVTFDDSGSMDFDYMGDQRPFDNKAWGSRWECAGVIDASATTGLGTHVMNGVYFNPNVTYTPPVNADGSPFPDADVSLTAVWNDGVTAKRPLNPSGSTSTTTFMGKKSGSSDKRWTCLSDSSSPLDNNGGPYYYRYTGPELTDNGFGVPSNLGDLYKNSNWTAVAIPSSQYQNWANWWAYYHDRNLMARTSLSRVFGATTLAATTSDGGYGSTLRVAWQNLNNSTYKLPANTLISSLIDTTPADCLASSKDKSLTLGSQGQQTGTIKTSPACYRSDFFNWIFQVGKSGGTPARSAANRAGQFFTRGNGNKGGTGDLHDPYWQPPVSGKGDGDELSCRQNFHVLMTDGLWNGDGDGPKYADLTLPASTLQLPDGTNYPDPTTAGVTSLYNAIHDVGDSGYASLSDIAFHYWATNLRPDLYGPDAGRYVAPYLPDTRTGVVSTTTKSSSKYQNNANVNNEIYFNPKNDPANWPHLSEYLIGLGVSGTLNNSENTDCTDTSGAASDACSLRKGVKNSSTKVGWPSPNGKGSGIAENIDDTWHAALAGRGQFFSAGNPQNLVDQLSNVLSNISARGAQPTTGAINASVLTTGALAFNTGYSSIDWTGVLQAYVLNADGTTGTFMWDAGATLSDASKTPPAKRKILTASRDGTTGDLSGMAFQPASAFDASEQAGLNAPTATDKTNDTLANRVDYLRGVRTQETGSVMRTRSSLLGAIINSQGVYLSYPASGYTENWPSGSVEAVAAAASDGSTDDKSYDAFVTNHADRAAMLYVGANDGMLHAFNAPVPTCTDSDPTTGVCTTYANAGNGSEAWAYVPRAVYANLGNLTSASSFKFAPTVDATPVARDVFFSDGSSAEWHSILVGGLRLGGRGVYALDVTDPTALDETASGLKKVLWEFDWDTKAPSDCVVFGSDNEGDTCDASHLGYTYGQPNVGRLANGKWVVIVPSGYFPDCSQTDRPVICNTTGYPTQPKDTDGNTYSSLFVLNAQTGAMIAELKTPTNISGVTSYGLTSPVLGDYDNNQVDDVAYAGDLAGNLWRFDLSDPEPANWKVTQAYNPATQGAQPITVMPRLFPDPATNRFMVVFGTGKYLGSGDNTSVSAVTQSIYGIRDQLDSKGLPVTVTHADLQVQTLTETAGTGDNAGATLRAVTSNTVPSTLGGWYIDLNITSAAGERVVVTPSAIFASNTVIISTLIPGSSDPCNPNVQGAIMALDATTGGAGLGVSSLGGIPLVGARVNNVRTSGSLPVATKAGGGSLILPGLTLTGKKDDPSKPLTLDAPIWRRRSWVELNNGQ